MYRQLFTVIVLLPGSLPATEPILPLPPAPAATPAARLGERLFHDPRLSGSGREEDRGVFQVPSLRNVALTAPYFHDGGVQTLEKAVTLMAELQLGTRPPPRDVKGIVAFLKSLTGRYLHPKPS